MQVFFNAFAQVLAFFYDLVPNYAVAIILLTLAVMIVVTPLTLKGTRSMMMMQQLQPEMRKIQTRYKDDRQKLNEELLKFYKENNINPLGGCLPLLVQMPVFLVLYQVLRGLTQRVSDVGFNVGWNVHQLTGGLQITKAPSIERVFDPAWLKQDSAMYQSLAGNTQMMAFGLDLSESASKALQQGVLHALPYLVLIAIVAATGFIQQRQIQGRNPNAQVNPQQQMIMKIMPIFLPVISFGLPAGLVLYFAVSNLYRIGQQAFISRSIYGMKKGQAAAAGGSSEPVPQQSFREAFGLAKRNAEVTAEKKASAKSKPKPTPAKSGATPRAKTKPAPSGGGRAQASPKASPKPPATSTAKSSAKSPAKPAPKSAKGGTPSGTGTSAGGAAPTLQPRARKTPKKR